jgi:hypothetical protein
MKKLVLLSKVWLVSLVTVGALFLFQPEPARGIRPCGATYAPVICSDCNFYANPCLAQNAGATDCVFYPVDCPLP